MPDKGNSSSVFPDEHREEQQNKNQDKDNEQKD